MMIFFLFRFEEEMARQLSTSVSDFVLALSAAFSVYHFYNKLLLYAAIGLLLQGIAASAGVVRFASLRSEMGPVFRTHKFLSWLAAAAGVPLLSYQFCTNYQAVTTSHVLLAFSGIVTLSAQFMNAENKQLFTQASSGLGLLIILILTITYVNVYGIIAGLIYVLTGAIVGSEGTLMGILRVDILHYGLAVGNIFFKLSLCD